MIKSNCVLGPLPALFFWGYCEGEKHLKWKEAEAKLEKKCNQKRQRGIAPVFVIVFLNVPSHQIRLAYKWYGRVGLDVQGSWIAHLIVNLTSIFVEFSFNSLRFLQGKIGVACNEI
jgi:hypothetical protein